VASDAQGVTGPIKKDYKLLMTPTHSHPLKTFCREKWREREGRGGFTGAVTEIRECMCAWVGVIDIL